MTLEINYRYRIIAHCLIYYKGKYQRIKVILHEKTSLDRGIGHAASNRIGGGLLTNYNQSAQYVRMLSRNASLDIDGVFYNPAGLTSLRMGGILLFTVKPFFRKER